VQQLSAEPRLILVVTFTRAAAHELRLRLASVLGDADLPHVSTLHAFALRQLLRNSRRIDALPQPVRIADDFEERHIIQEDIKRLLRLARIKEAQGLFALLSADWQSLSAEEADWERRFPDAKFLGAWRQHRGVYGYTLRSELVYQLKRALEQVPDFDLEGPPGYLVVDEYQDLNRCDLAVVRAVVERGAVLYAAGDDDQSIYGFRMAQPEGIRRFPTDYPGANPLELALCQRCNPSILELGLWVAEQDYEREAKAIHAAEGRPAGEVHLLRFGDQEQEADGVAAICKHLVDVCDIAPDGILVLIRSDRRGLFSSMYAQKLSAHGIPAAAVTDDKCPLDSGQGRALLAFLRLLVRGDDHLSWRTLLEFCRAGIGSGTLEGLYDLAVRRGAGFAEAVRAAHDDKSLLPSGQRRVVVDKAGEILSVLEEYAGVAEATTLDDVMAQVALLADSVVEDVGEREAVVSELGLVGTSAGARSLRGLLSSVGSLGEDLEQEREPGKVNILTMHKAKGLTAEAVVIAASEDEYIPGRQLDGPAFGDERRLLYVSLTRAKHRLYITYAGRRRGRQKYSGRTSGTEARTLTRFLRDSPVRAEDGRAFVKGL